MAVLNVEAKSRDVVKPSSPTPDNCKTLKLCFVDQFAPPIYTPFIFFYQTPLTHKDYQKTSTLLRQSLSETLTQFYPLAGKVDGNSSIDCNDQGVEFYEANVFANLSQVLDNPNPDELLKLLPFSPVANHTTATTAVQVNHFLCNSVAISVLISHKIADGATFAAFVDAWATKARCLAEYDHGVVVASIDQAKFDAASLLPPKEPSLFNGIEKLMSNDELVTRRLVFNKETLDMLKRASMDESRIKPPTRVEVVSAYIWKKFIEAARAKPQPPQICYASQAVNLRNILSSPATYGNLFWLGFAYVTAEEEVEYPKITDKLRGAATQINVKYLEKFENGEECLEEIKKNCESSLKGVAESCGFSSCIRFPLYEADFGWGKPIWVSMTTLPLKNSVFFLSTKCGEGIEAWINISVHDVALFEQHI